MHTSRFCYLHQQSHDSGKCYKKRIRVLKEISKRKGWPLNHTYTLNRLTWEQKSLLRLDREIASMHLVKFSGWGDAYAEIKKRAVDIYPNSFPYIEHINARDRSCFDSLIRSVLKVADDQKPKETILAYQSFSKNLGDKGLRRFFIALIARLDIEKGTLEGIKYKRGPEIGSVQIRESIWSDLFTAFHEQNDLGITPRLSEIARKHKVSRQSVHQRWKKILANPKAYREALQKQLNLNNKFTTH